MTGYPEDHAVPNARSEVIDLLHKMRGAINNGAYQRMHQLTDQIEMVARTYLEPAIIDPLPGSKLTKVESRVYARLLHTKGRGVSRSQLMDSVYFDRAGEEPDEKIMDVFICKLRKKLPAHLMIETVYAQGWMLKELAA